MLSHAKASTMLDIYGQLIVAKQEEAVHIMDVTATPIPIEMEKMLEVETSDFSHNCKI